MATERIAVIGGGRMGEAIVAGLLSSGTVGAGDVVVADPSSERRQVFAEHGVETVADGREAVPGADVVLLAVKPQVIDAVVAHLADGIEQRALVISIAAGIPTKRIEAQLPEGAPVVRVMPNAPAMSGCGMSVISPGRSATAEHVSVAERLFDAIGRTVVLDEAYQDAATALSGSGPAYVALFIDALTRAGVSQGLARDVSLALTLQTVRGTVELIEQTGAHPEAVIDSVASPGGTTIAAIEALEAGGLRASIFAAVAAAVRRARELGSR